MVSIGRELVKGRIPDTNGPYLADYFTQRGALVHRITVVDDSERAIAEAVREALSRRPHLVVTSGGLGPTADDRTLAGVGEALRLPLSINQRARRSVEAAYSRLRAARQLDRAGMNAVREKMCSIPVGSEPIPSEIGIAPGVLVRLVGGAAVLCLPGVPEEMRSVFEAALPLLKELEPKGHLAVREVEAPTADESSLRPLLDRISAEYPRVWVKSHAPGFGRGDARILVSLEATAPTRDEAEQVVEGALRRLIALAAGVR